MQYDLKDKTIQVIDANSGIGKAASDQLTRRGATSIMACGSMDEVHNVQEWIAHDLD